MSALAEGLKLPAPPLHVAVVAPPPIEPASWTWGTETAHANWSGPAFTVAPGRMKIDIWSLTCGHGPVGSFVVSVSVTPPPVISAAEGV